MKKLLVISLMLSALVFGTGSRRRFIPPAVVSGGTPTLSSATLVSDNIGIVTMQFGFSQSCTNGAGGSGGVTITPSGGASTTTYSSGSPGSTFTYSSSRQILKTETATCAYTQPGNGIEATTGGVDLATFSGTTVTNNSTIVALDDFSGTLAAWNNVAGTAFAIVSSQLSVTTSGFGVIEYNTTPTSNARASITLRTTPTANFTIDLYLRYDALSNGYYLHIVNSTWTIYKDTVGVQSTVATGSVSSATGDIVGFETNGSSIIAYKNGTSVVSGTDASFTAAQKYTIAVNSLSGSQTVAFDNFVLQNL